MLVAAYEHAETGLSNVDSADDLSGLKELWYEFKLGLVKLRESSKGIVLKVEDSSSAKRKNTAVEESQRKKVKK
jgi:hypothetical protein